MSISFDRVAGIYDATRGLPPQVSEQIADCILSIVSATPDTKFFEPGIGTGRIAIPIVLRGYSYTGVDISEKMMNQLRQQLQGEPNQLTLLQADATSLPFSSQSFDVALAAHLLHLIPAWREALAEIHRVLKPNGVFLYCYNYAGLRNHKEFDREWQMILAKHGFQLTEYGAAKEKVMEALIEQGAILETVTAAQWQSERTVGELLTIYEEKMHSSSWQIPEDIFSVAIKELKEWALQYYKSEEVALSADAKFELTVARNWAFDVLPEQS
ncbi:methyltransferase domain-containing protein [Lyngbya aestuarii]|uniref:methyltransferase domain-containing protein n=1 Tax=Lyngbya aestuarii TaxID=118322 RepID=UPI00403D7D3C